MAMVELNEAHVARSRISAIRPITHGTVLDWAKVETSPIIRRLKEQIGVISMTGTRLDSVEVFPRIHVFVDDMGMYIDLSDGWAKAESVGIEPAETAFRSFPLVPLAHPCLRSYKLCKVNRSSQFLHGRFQATE